MSTSHLLKVFAITALGVAVGVEAVRQCPSSSPSTPTQQISNQTQSAESPIITQAKIRLLQRIAEEEVRSNRFNPKPDTKAYDYGDVHKRPTQPMLITIYPPTKPTKDDCIAFTAWLFQNGWVHTNDIPEVCQP